MVKFLSYILNQTGELHYAPPMHGNLRIEPVHAISLFDNFKPGRK